MPPQLSNAIARTLTESIISRLEAVRQAESVSWVFSLWFALCVVFSLLLIRRILMIEAEQRRSRAEFDQILREIRADADSDIDADQGGPSAAE